MTNNKIFLENEKVIIAVYQNIGTALLSIDELLKKTKDVEFKGLLNEQYDRYEKLCDRVIRYADKNKVDLKPNSWFEKVKLWSSINLTTLTDNSTRHLAEMMLLGTVMGTLTCYKDRFDHQRADADALKILETLERLEEKNFIELKKYLKG